MSDSWHLDVCPSAAQSIGRSICLLSRTCMHAAFSLLAFPPLSMHQAMCIICHWTSLGLALAFLSQSCIFAQHPQQNQNGFFNQQKFVSSGDYKLAGNISIMMKTCLLAIPLHNDCPSEAMSCAGCPGNGTLRSNEFNDVRWETDCRPAAMADVLRVHEWSYVLSLKQASPQPLFCIRPASSFGSLSALPG